MSSCFELDSIEILHFQLLQLSFFSIESNSKHDYNEGIVIKHLGDVSCFHLS